ncbi:competence protein CoiA family protein [Rhizobium leguminosarum]|uniref:competence protein CoiA family protein n=1 Tax=Rhizobium leguminosarum TaxID=384 RepID=UPI003F9930C3
MNFARDNQSNRVVSATDAKRRRDYLCPVCDYPVLLRQGTYRAAHFAHVVRAARPECDLYHPSQGLSDWHLLPTTGGEAGSATPPLLLSITVESAPLRPSRPAQWMLNITVPRAETSKGSIVIECGNGNHRRIEMAKLALAAQTYAVDPDTRSYYASWTSREVPAGYSASVRERLPAPRPDRFAVFSATKDRYKPVVASLRWGRDYYFIWRQGLAAEIPEDLLVAELATAGSWHCALVALPEYGAPETERWLIEHTGLALSGPSSQWGVIFPPPLGTTASGDLVLPDARPLVLSFASNDEADRTVQLISTNRLKTLDLPVPRHTSKIIAVPDAKAEERTGSIRFGEHVSQGLNWTTKNHTWTDAVIVQLLDPATGAVTAFQLHLPASHDALLEARNGRLSLVSFATPGFLKPVIRDRALTEITWTERQMPSTNGAEWLGALIVDREKDIWIDCGAYGSWIAEGQQTEHKRPSILTRDGRRKLEWLFLVNGVHTLAGRRLSKAQDHEMVTGLERLRLKPEMAGHARRMLQSIGRRR